jgi:hypothetical protein
MKTISVEEFDKKFDAGEDISEYLDYGTIKAVHPAKPKRINIDLPDWLLNSIDEEANRIGVTRQSILKVWIAERIEENQVKRAALTMPH